MLLRVARLQAQSPDVTTLCQNALRPLVEELEVDAATFYLRDGDCLKFSGRFHVPDAPVPSLEGFLELTLDDESTLHGRASRTLRPVVVSRETWPERSRRLADSGKARHAAVFPLAVRERLLGTFMVVRTADRPFTPEEISSLDSCAAHLAVAIDQARLIESERRRADELRRILDLGQSVNQSLELVDVLRTATRHLAHVSQATFAIIYLRDGDDLLRAVGVFPTEREPELERIRIPLHEASAAVRALQTAAPIVVESTAGSELFHRELVERYGIRSVCALPLTHRDQALGSIVLADSTRERNWAAEVEPSTVLARQVSAAVVNARLYESLRQSLREVERSQKRLVAQERLAALGELSAIVAHEVRNPLGVIFNAVSHLRPDARGESAVLLSMVAEEAERLNRLTEGLLAFARPQPTAMSLTQLAPLLGSAIEVARCAVPSAKAPILEEIDARLDAMMDTSMIRQALVNLLVNALHATQRGGDVWVSAGALAANRVRIEVRDSGPGIPAALLERVFQPFFTTKAMGSGLGLAIVKRIVDAHQGELRLEPHSPHGCRFVMELQRSPAISP